MQQWYSEVCSPPDIFVTLHRLHHTQIRFGYRHRLLVLLKPGGCPCARLCGWWKVSWSCHGGPSAWALKSMKRIYTYKGVKTTPNRKDLVHPLQILIQSLGKLLVSGQTLQAADTATCKQETRQCSTMLEECSGRRHQHSQSAGWHLTSNITGRIFEWTNPCWAVLSYIEL